jgi:hypothetical protein
MNKIQKRVSPCLRLGCLEAECETGILTYVIDCWEELKGRELGKQDKAEEGVESSEV